MESNTSVYQGTSRAGLLGTSLIELPPRPIVSRLGLSTLVHPTSVNLSKSHVSRWFHGTTVNRLYFHYSSVCSLF